MKLNRNIQVLAFLLLIFPVQLMSQDCDQHHLEGDCRFDLQKGYDSYSQSHSTRITPQDTVEMNVIFYGQKDYILSFCTHRKLYPVHFVLIDQQTKEVLYDNKDDDFLESLGLGFDVTKSLIIKVNVLARLSTTEEIDEKIGCLGFLIQYKNYPKKKVNLQL
jgi:hypothetical protein